MKKFADQTLTQYLEELSSEKPVPGGGSVSAYVASLAMGLTQMVARIALKRKLKDGLSPEELNSEKEKRKTLEQVLESLEKTKQDSLQIVDLDPEVYHKVMAEWADEKKREDNLENSFRLQADLACLIVMTYEWNAHLAHLVKGSIRNDLLVSAGLLEGSFRGAYHTAMINAHYMEQADRKQRAESALGELKNRFERARPK